MAPGSYTSAAIIMLTDGQRTTGVDPLEAAKMAADRGVRVYTVGIGTVDGETIGFEGWSMRVRLDEETLKAIANKTSAEYFYAGTAHDLKKVYETLSSQADGGEEGNRDLGAVRAGRGGAGAAVGRPVAALVQPDSLTLAYAQWDRCGEPDPASLLIPVGRCAERLAALTRSEPQPPPAAPPSAAARGRSAPPALVVRDHHEGRAALARQLEHQRRTRRRRCRGRGCRSARRPARRPGCVDQRARDRDALALAARQLARPVRARARPGPTAASIAARLLARLAPAHRGGCAAASHVVERGELRQQVVELVDEAEVPVAQLALRGRVQLREVAGPCSCTVPAVGASRPPSRCSSVLLPEPEAPTIASVSPRAPRGRRRCSTCARRAPPFGEALVQAAGSDDAPASRAARVTHSAAPRPD